MRAVKPNGLIEKALFVKAEFVSPLLGSQPADSVAHAYLRQRSIERLTDELKRHHGLSATEAKRRAEEQVSESLDMSDEERDEAGVPVSVFHSDDMGIHLMDYHVQGSFKEARKVLDLKVPAKTAGRGDVSSQQDLIGGLWVFPTKAEYQRRLYIRREGLIIEEADRAFDRPKRVNVRGIEQSSIAVSEVIDPPAQIEFVIALLRGCRLTMDQVEEMLAYMSFNGLGQWRGGGHGRIMCEVDDLDPGRVAVQVATHMRMAMTAKAA